MRSINNKLDVLCRLLEINNIDIAIISETHLPEDKKISIKNYKIVRKDRDKNGGGVLIAVHKNFKIKKINLTQSNKIESVGVRIFHKNKKVIDIISVYSSPSTKFSSQDFDFIFQSIESPYIIGGDLNAHSMEWGCQEDSIKGDAILNAIEKYNAVIINDGSITRPQVLPRISSAIDITMTNVQNAINCDWQVLNSSLGSDHLPITIKIKMRNKIDREDKIIFSYNKIKNKMQDSEFIKNNLIEIKNCEDFNKFLIDIKKNSKIKIPQQYTRVSKPWWNNECSAAMAKCILVSKMFNKKMNRENYEGKKNAEINLKKIKENAKKEGWKKFCSSLDHESPISDVWKMAKKFKTGKNNHQIDSLEWVEEFMDKHTPPHPLMNFNPNILPLNETKLFLWNIQVARSERENRENEKIFGRDRWN